MNKLFILLLIFYSCKKSTSSNLNGIYTEDSPVFARCQLHFLPNNILIKTESNSLYRDSFSYIITNNQITLTPIWVNATRVPSNFYFEKIDENTIKIENLYPSIGFVTTYMQFKK